MKVILENGSIMPTRAHDDDAGLDLATPVDFTIPERGYIRVDLGIHAAIPAGNYGKLESRSGLMSRGITTMGGVIDAGYTGSISVCLFNHNDYPVNFYRGDRVTQLIVVPHLAVYPEPSKRLDETMRGDGGFGSTGA